MTVRSQPLNDGRVRVDFITYLAPAWSRRAADWLGQQDSSWRAISVVLSLLLLLLGIALLFGGGYTSIQGVRVPLALAGLPVETRGLPPLVWWLIPLGNTFVQIICRHVVALRVLWRPSVIYDATTNALFLSFGLLAIAARLQVAIPFTLTAPLIVLVASSAVLGLILAVCAEHLVLGALCLLRALR